MRHDGRSTPGRVPGSPDGRSRAASGGARRAPLGRLAAAILALLLAAPGPLAAQGAPQAGAGPAAEARRPPERGPEGRKLPPDQTTEHSLSLPDGRSLAFAATAGSLPLVDEGGKLQAEIAFVAYTRPAKAGEAQRPITFAINGGPGASSAYLNIGAIGPWRLPTDGGSISPSRPVTLVPNDGTWLDFTDLVFIDPVGTGYSRAADGDAKRYWSVDADASVLAAAIARYLRVNDRMGAPKFYVGESYGGFRGPLIAGKLQEDVGVGLSGLVLLSPVLDFGWLQPPRTNPWGHVTRLPSFAAAALERGGAAVNRSMLADAESYATGAYLGDLLKGPNDAAAVARLTDRVSALTGLDPAFVRAQAGRLTAHSVQREIDRAGGRVASAYDTGVTGWDPDPTAPHSGFEDPLLTAIQAPLTSAMVELYARQLNWRVTNLRYELLNGAVNRGWTWGSGRSAPEAVNALRGALALDGNLRVLVAHGFTDLVTPYFVSKLLIDQLPDYGTEKRLSLAVYPGGHMFYSRPEARAAFQRDVAALYASALKARTAIEPRAGIPTPEHPRDMP
ncbi:S10 family peptidase [Methylobacterium planeticum]|uniref:Peptidase S10 n=1 Tax=Methylobacterium planeticum TaxID=2615211 RepID=A0A6N6MQM3_9HYPH|nr:peptidase S10 [Methylobacterium planeticum]KAB1072633.1 peptidase S10 [Methylobacterium planeticum]